MHELYASHAKDQRRKEVLDKYLGYALTAYKSMKLIFQAIVPIMVGAPLLLYIFFDKRFSTLMVYMPFLDRESSPGFELNFLFMSYMFYLTYHGLTTTATFVVAMTIMGMGHLSVIQVMINELQQLLVTDPDPVKLERQIKAIVVEHQKHLRYTRLFEETFRGHALVDVLCSASMAVVCLLVLVKQLWVLGFVLIAIAVWHVFFICILGEFVQQSCTRFSDALFETDWYLLPPRLRKQWHLVLMMSQQPNLITLGGAWPSNLNTFQRVSKLH